MSVRSRKAERQKAAAMDKKDVRLKEEEQVFHMWEPVRFEVGSGYDYLRDTHLKRFGRAFLLNIVTLLLTVFNYVWFGTTVRGRKNLKAVSRTGAVTVCNHIHPMDCTMVNTALWGRRRYFVSLESNFRIPIAGHLLKILGAVPMSSKTTVAIEMFEAMEKALKDGVLVHIYPEGVLVPYAEGIRDFKNGAFRLAFRAHVPVLPLVISQSEPAGLLKILKRRPCLKVEILPPVYFEDTQVARKTAGGLKAACQNIYKAYFSKYR